MSDLIFRENVLKNFENMCEDCFAYTREKKEIICRRCFIQTVKDIIKESPSVKPELKKGKWMEKETFDNADYEIPVWQSARCSVCGKYMTAPYQYYFTDFSYCPNCGSYNGDDNEK